jgi:hypothetical protein
MVNYDLEFNTSGKFPTDANFWKDYGATFVSGDAITNGFKTVLGEQVFRPLGDVRTPFYNKFAGRPLQAGAGWKERAIFKNTSKHFKPKATAQDDLGYEDSEGLEVTYEVNVEGWIKATIPSSLKTVEMMINQGEIGELSSMLVDNVIKTYQADLESVIAKKTVSNIKDDVEIDFTDGVEAWKTINRLAIEFMGDSVHHNQLTAEQNAKLRKVGGKVLCFIDAVTYEDMVSSFAALPSPDYINKYVEYIPVMDGLPTPLTTAEFDAGTGTDGAGTSITWDTKPIAIDEPKPKAILITDNAVEYRPVIGSYRMNISKNGAGDFENQHLLYSGSLKAVDPMSDALRLNPKSD